MTQNDKAGKPGKPDKAGKPESFVTEITPRSQDFSRWYLDVVRAPNWPTTRRSRAAWSSGRTATRSGS